MDLSQSHSMPVLQEAHQGKTNERNAFDVILSYINLLIKNMHCIDINLNEASPDLLNSKDLSASCYNEIAKCDLNANSLQSCRRLIKAIGIFNEKVNLIQYQLINYNKDGKNMKNQTKSESNSEIDHFHSLNSNRHLDDLKQYDIRGLVSDTHQHAKLIERHIDNIKRYMKSIQKGKKQTQYEETKSIRINSKEEDKEKDDDNDQSHHNSNEVREAFIERELARLNKENKALKVEMQFIAEQLKSEGKITVINAKPTFSKVKSPPIDDEDSLNLIFSSDICFQLTDNFKEHTWVMLKKFINKLKDAKFDM